MTSNKEHFEYIPCNPETPCKYREEDDCFEDIHHEAYPKSEYRGQLEKRFRECALNKVLICRAVHDDIHKQDLPPRKPSEDTMREVLADAKEYKRNGGAIQS